MKRRRKSIQLVQYRVYYETTSLQDYFIMIVKRYLHSDTLNLMFQSKYGISHQRRQQAGSAWLRLRLGICMLQIGAFDGILALNHYKLPSYVRMSLSTGIDLA